MLLAGRDISFLITGLILFRCDKDLAKLVKLNSGSDPILEEITTDALLWVEALMFTTLVVDLLDLFLRKPAFTHDIRSYVLEQCRLS